MTRSLFLLAWLMSFADNIAEVSADSKLWCLNMVSQEKHFMSQDFLVSTLRFHNLITWGNCNIYIYMYIYTHTHTYIYIYIYITIKLSSRQPNMVMHLFMHWTTDEWFLSTFKKSDVISQNVEFEIICRSSWIEFVNMVYKIWPVYGLSRCFLVNDIRIRVRGKCTVIMLKPCQDYNRLFTSRIWRHDRISS